MKYYLIFVISLVIVVALFGGILPALVSAKSTEAVLLAGVILLTLPVCVIGAVKFFNKKEVK